MSCVSYNSNHLYLPGVDPTDGSMVVQRRFEARVVTALRPCGSALRGVRTDARVVADFQSKWEEKRNGRSRALFADQPRPTMQPVVSPRLTNEYPLGVFNSRVKVVAELDARKVEYPLSLVVLRGECGELLRRGG